MLCVDRQIFPEGTSAKFSHFFKLSDAEQRVELSSKEKAEDYIRMFFEIVKKVQSDRNMVTYALLLIDGLLEEKRTRIEHLIAIQASHKKDKQLDIIAILNSFLWSNPKATQEQKDLASHILAQLIE